MRTVASMREAFTRAYETGQWHNGSGSGSSLANTVAYREFLRQYMAEHQISTVVDLGCGDWQFSRLINWNGLCWYEGIDVVPELVERNIQLYGRQGKPGQVWFAQADILTCGLPHADLYLVKDLLQHWPDDAIHQLGERLAGQRALLTYDLNGPEHADTPPAGYRPLDLSQPPFSWPVREVLRYESVSHEGRIRRLKVVHEL